MCCIEISLVLDWNEFLFLSRLLPFVLVLVVLPRLLIFTLHLPMHWLRRMTSKLGLLEPAKKHHVRSCPHVSRCLSTSHYHLINIAALSIREEYVVVRHREALLEPEAFVPCGSWDIDVFLAHEVPLPHFSIPVHDFHFFWSLGPPRLSLRPSLHVVAETGAPRAAALTGCTAGRCAGRASCVRSA